MDEATKTIRLVPKLLSDGSLWQIEVRYPDGKAEMIVGFESKTEAIAWIRTNGKRWGRKRMMASHPTPLIIDIGETEANEQPRNKRCYNKKMDPTERSKVAKEAALKRWHKSRNS